MDFRILKFLEKIGVVNGFRRYVFAAVVEENIVNLRYLS